MATLTMAVNVNAVSHYYCKVVALDQLSLTIPQGSITGIIGPDGVGKSTLLGLIAGAKRLQQGTLFTLNHDTSKTFARQWLSEHIAYMPQGLGSNLYEDLSIYDNIQFFADIFSLKKTDAEARILLLTERTGLKSFLSRRVKLLSGGMKQKLGLCCALIHTPQLLILDEPTTGVDPLSRVQFWELLAQIRRENPAMTVIVATSYMAEAEQFDYMYMMDKGVLLAQGTPQELKTKTHSDDLEAAYIALLPLAERGRLIEKIIKPHVLNAKITIEAKNLTRRFGDFIAVDHLNFSVHQGEIFGFLGPNGSGKTTTMKMLMGLLPATSGEALVFSQKVESGSIQLRKRLGYMSQSFSLYGELSVTENLILHAALFDLTKEKTKERMQAVIEFCDLIEILTKNTGRLPLGLRQRLSLAVAVLHEPELLILDEPTSGVDPIARQEFWHLIYQLACDKGVTVFVSTHYLSEAMNCDRVVLMNAGRILACDKPTQLIERYPGNTLEDVFIYLIREDNKARGEVV